MRLLQFALLVTLALGLPLNTAWADDTTDPCANADPFANAELLNWLVPGQFRLYYSIIPILDSEKGETSSASAAMAFEATSYNCANLLDLLGVPISDIERALNCFGDELKVTIRDIGQPASEDARDRDSDLWFAYSDFECGSSYSGYKLDQDLALVLNRSLNLSLERQDLLDTRITVPLLQAGYIASQVRMRLLNDSASGIDYTDNATVQRMIAALPNLCRGKSSVRLGVEDIDLGMVHLYVTKSKLKALVFIRVPQEPDMPISVGRCD